MAQAALLFRTSYFIHLTSAHINTQTFQSFLHYLVISNCKCMNSGMRNDVRDYFKRIVWTASLIFLWLTTTVAVGAYNNLLVPEHGMHTSNIIFYIWMGGSLAGLIYLLVRIWSRKFPHG